MADQEHRAQTKRRKRDRLKQLGERLIYSKQMLPGIGIASFLEALIVPIPLETILIPLLQARRARMWLISTIVLGACLVAATIGYAVGYFIFDAYGAQLVSLFATPEEFARVQLQMQNKGFWFVFSVGVMPIPFQIAMLAAGATKYPLILFLAASALSRAIRYYGLAVLVYYTGNQAQRVFERHKTSVGLGLLVIVSAAWAFAIWG